MTTNTRPQPETRLERHQKLAEWYAELIKAIRHRWGEHRKDAAYWVSFDAKIDHLSLDALFKGWFHVSARPGANEGHVVEMIWIGNKDDVTHFGTIKSDAGFKHALAIANWLTHAIYYGVPKDDA